MPHPQNACTSSCAICNPVAKVDDGTIFSAWKTTLKIKLNLQRRNMYSAIVLSKCTDFSQTKANCECVQILSTANFIAYNFLWLAMENKVVWKKIHICCS